MKYTELIESCKKAIEKGYCGGCQGIEQEEYRGDPNCPYKIPSVQESIKQIKLNLRNWRQKMKYHNKKTQVDMYIFDSALEAKRYKQLALLEKTKEIKNLRL